MFQVRFDFDLEEYKRRLEHFKRTNTKPTYFQGPGQARLREACTALGRWSALAARPGRLRDRLLLHWFGTSSGAAAGHLTRLNAVIADPSRSVLFVDGKKRHVAVKVNPQNIDQPQVLMDTPYGDDKMQYAGAWVHTLPGTGAARAPGEYHVGSGMRIVLGRAFPMSGDVYERAGVVYHELSHKVIGTNDHVYGANASRQLAQISPAQAAKNADNYNSFIQEFAKLHDKGVRA